MHLLPVMDTVSRFVIPLFWEAFCITLSTMIYRITVYERSKHFITHIISIIFIVMVSSGIVKQVVNSALRTGLECAIAQGGYSRQDYVMIERYPALGIKMAEKYLGHIEEIANERFIVLPESAFPLRQIEDSEILRVIKNTARLRNEYIMTGILLVEGEKVYNASALINPDGILENVYRKRNTVLFVETSTFTRGIRANTFSIDGHTIAPVICYESVFIRDYFRDTKPELYIVISNDIFSDKIVLSTLHIAYGVINARTLDTPLLQVMQNGPSIYLDSQGRLKFLTRPYEKNIGLHVEIK